MFEERRALIFTQLDRQTSRARLIQRAMAAYYTALGIFVATTRGDRDRLGGGAELYLDRRRCSACSARCSCSTDRCC